MKIFAVIVTYNRVELLKECLQSVFKQKYKPDQIIVINSNSSDGTADYLNGLGQKIDAVHLKKNLGGAGGFYHGLKKAYEDGAQWVWVMDDDCIAQPTALQALVDCPAFANFNYGPETGFLASRVDWTDGHRHIMNVPGVHGLEWNRYIDQYPGCIKISAASFVSLLIKREAIQKVGYPVKEFFIWYDDWEYTQRLSRIYAGFYVPQSVVVHKTPDNSGAGFETINKQNIWKYEYGVRNQIAVMRQGKIGFLRSVVFLLDILAKNRRKNVFVILRIFKAGIKGLFFRYRRRIEFPMDSPNYRR